MKTCLNFILNLNYNGHYFQFSVCNLFFWRSCRIRPVPQRPIKQLLRTRILHWDFSTAWRCPSYHPTWNYQSTKKRIFRPSSSFTTVKAMVDDVSIQELCLQGFSTVGSVTGRASGPWNNLTGKTPEVHLWETFGGKWTNMEWSQKVSLKQEPKVLVVVLFFSSKITYVVRPSFSSCRLSLSLAYKQSSACPSLDPVYTNTHEVSPYKESSTQSSFPPLAK